MAGRPKIVPDADIIRMAQEGLTSREIAESFGVHVTAIQKRANGLGVRFKRKTDRHAQIIPELFADGKGMDEIADRLGIGQSQLYKRMRHLEIEKPGSKRVKVVVVAEKKTPKTARDIENLDRERKEFEDVGRRASQVLEDRELLAEVLQKACLTYPDVVHNILKNVDIRMSRCLKGGYIEFVNNIHAE